jgi:cytochrome c556
MKRVVAVLIFVLLTQGAAFAHEGAMHEGAMHEGKQSAKSPMVKLHKMMPMYAKAQAKINAALENKDLATVAKETQAILATTGDLKISKPHKQVQKLGYFKRIAEAFEKEVKNTAEMAKKKDIEGAKASFATAEQRCAECHAKFRD